MFYFDLARQNIIGTPSLGTPSLVQQIQYIGTKKNLHKSHLSQAMKIFSILLFRSRSMTGSVPSQFICKES